MLGTQFTSPTRHEHRCAATYSGPLVSHLSLYSRPFLSPPCHHDSHFFTSSSPRASPRGLRSPPVVPLDQLQAPGPSCDDPNGCRSLWDIIRSCILTIMHPNIQCPDERWPRTALRRAGLMLLTLIAPEAVIGWALRQRAGCGRTGRGA